MRWVFTASRKPHIDMARCTAIYGERLICSVHAHRHENSEGNRKKYACSTQWTNCFSINFSCPQMCDQWNAIIHCALACESYLASGALCAFYIFVYLADVCCCYMLAYMYVQFALSEIHRSNRQVTVKSMHRRKMAVKRDRAQAIETKDSSFNRS